MSARAKVKPLAPQGPLQAAQESRRAASGYNLPSTQFRGALEGLWIKKRLVTIPKVQFNRQERTEARLWLGLIWMREIVKDLLVMVRICADCGADISHKGNRAKRCDNCLGPYYLKRMEKKKTSQMLSRGGYEYTLPSQDIRQISNHEGYPYQSTGKEYFKIFQGTNITRIKKICRSCGKDDSFVRGKWAPIYSETDFRGVELDYILLCLDCYQSKCEGS